MDATSTGNIFKHIFLNENIRISIQFSLKFVPKGAKGTRDITLVSNRPLASMKKNAMYLCNICVDTWEKMLIMFPLP